MGITYRWVDLWTLTLLFGNKPWARLQYQYCFKVIVASIFSELLRFGRWSRPTDESYWVKETLSAKNWMRSLLQLSPTQSSGDVHSTLNIWSLVFKSQHGDQLTIEWYFEISQLVSWQFVFSPICPLHFPPSSLLRDIEAILRSRLAKHFLCCKILQPTRNIFFVRWSNSRD